MSSFKKRSTITPIPGTRPSSSSSLPLISVGLPTIDDLLGGGLPLSTSLLITQDYPTSYSELLLRYFITQGLESNQETLLISSKFENNDDGIFKVLMGNDKGTTTSSTNKTKEVEEDEEERKKEEEIKEKMKIAFRYEGMKQHQTTLNSTTNQNLRTGGEETVYCSTFDLTTTRSLSPSDLSKLHSIDIDELQDTSSSPADFYNNLYQKIETFVSQNGYLQSSTSPRKALRIAISSIGSPSWGQTSPPSLYTFLHRLRSLLRRSNASSLTTFPSHLYPSTSSTSGGGSSNSSISSPLLSKLSHSSDSVLSLLSTSCSPILSNLYPSHQGLITLPKLPSLSSLLPPSNKISLLKNLGGGGQGRENLLGFRVKRRRFVVEVVSEEPEFGGQGEDEQEKKLRERRKRVEEANRKDREEGGKATDVLLGERKSVAREKGKIVFEAEEEKGELEKGMRNVRIGGEENESRIENAPPPPATTSAFKQKKKGVRMGGVSFQDEEIRVEGAKEEEEKTEPKKQKKVSISAMLHQQPELLDF
ncbi:hypothetical protein JCM3765_007347 [Sporobolomyces pararoseus]